MTITEELASRGYSSIPARRSPVGHLEVDAAVNGHEARLLVDTGASNTVIDLDSARRWQLDTREQDRSGCGVGISGPVRLAKIAELRLSNLQLQELDVAVLDLSGINAGLRTRQANRIDGVLGADVLLSRQAIIEVAPAMLHLLRDSASV